MRLIDADALIPIMKYTTTDNEIGVFPIKIGFDAIKGVIDESPSIDAVEVVRCGECKHMIADGRCMEFADDGIRPSAMDYCSYGERREGGEA